MNKLHALALSAISVAPFAIANASAAENSCPPHNRVQSGEYSGWEMSNDSTKDDRSKVDGFEKAVITIGGAHDTDDVSEVSCYYSPDFILVRETSVDEDKLTYGDWDREIETMPGLNYKTYTCINHRGPDCSWTE